MPNAIRNQLKEHFKRLHPNIQQRFICDPERPITYHGKMHIIRRSTMGWFFAQITRILNHPLTPYQGENVPIDVILHKHKNGVCWKRSYYYPQRKPYVVTSTKKESMAGEMMECVGGGFGMLLKVYEKDTALHFESHHFFWQLFGMRITLPHWLTPGKTHVIHQDLDNGTFSFTISIQHKYFGETFFQYGIFKEGILYFNSKQIQQHKTL